MSEPIGTPVRDGTITLRRPRLSDAGRLVEIARDSRVLDVNSGYAYLLWCRDFRDTTVVAVRDGRVVGFVTGYVRPEVPDTLFVWQVAVDVDSRGRGLGGSMLDCVLDRVSRFGVRFVETTVTPGNRASHAMFTALAGRWATGIHVRPLFSPNHFPDGHDAEDLYTIGPIRAGGNR